MPPSSFEVALQTMGSLFGDCLVDKNGVPVMSKDGMNQLLTEMFPHSKKKEISPGVYEIRIPLRKTGPGVPHDKGPLVDFQRARIGAGSVSDLIDSVIASINFMLGLDESAENINDDIFPRIMSLQLTLE